MHSVEEIPSLLLTEQKLLQKDCAFKGLIAGRFDLVLVDIEAKVVG